MEEEGENGEYLSYAFKTRTQVLQTVQFSSAHSLIQGHARSFLEKLHINQCCRFGFTS